MPNPKDKAKASGDVHLPEVESEDLLQREDSRPEGAGNPDGQIKDREAPTSDSYGDTRDSGEQPKSK
jgi:hypothetical protein